MHSIRLIYLALFVLTTFLGLVSRSPTIPRDSWVYLYIGDSLWAMMIFWAAGMTLSHIRLSHHGMVAWLLCVTIELSQLVSYPWLNDLRQTLLGKLILGQGFLWTDLLMYSLGILIAYQLARLIER